MALLHSKRVDKFVDPKAEILINFSSQDILSSNTVGLFLLFVTTKEG